MSWTTRKIKFTIISHFGISIGFRNKRLIAITRLTEKLITMAINHPMMMMVDARSSSTFQELCLITKQQTKRRLQINASRDKNLSVRMVSNRYRTLNFKIMH